MVTEQELRRVTIEEYIEANGGMAEFLNGLDAFARENGFYWTTYLSAMMSDVEYRARMFARIGVGR